MGQASHSSKIWWRNIVSIESAVTQISNCLFQERRKSVQMIEAQREAMFRGFYIGHTSNTGVFCPKCVSHDSLDDSIGNSWVQHLTQKIWRVSPTWPIHTFVDVYLPGVGCELNYITCWIWEGFAFAGPHIHWPTSSSLAWRVWCSTDSFSTVCTEAWWYKKLRQNSWETFWRMPQLELALTKLLQFRDARAAGWPKYLQLLLPRWAPVRCQIININLIMHFHHPCQDSFITLPR